MYTTGFNTLNLYSFPIHGIYVSELVFALFGLSYEEAATLPFGTN